MIKIKLGETFPVWDNQRHMVIGAASLWSTFPSLGKGEATYMSWCVISGGTLLQDNCSYSFGIC